MLSRLTAILIFLALASAHAEDFTFYQVKKEDHLIKILRSLGYKENLWGPRGIIETVIKENPWISDDVDYLPVGIYLKLPTKKPKIEKKPEPKIKIVQAPPKELIKFRAPSERSYKLVLIETDGKNEFRKMDLPMQMRADPQSGEAVFILAQVDKNELQKAALKDIPHFKEKFFAEKKVVKTKTTDGRTIEKVEYKPWELSSRFFIRGFAGTKFMAISTEATSTGSLDIGASPGFAGNLHMGINFTERFGTFLDVGGDYLTFKAPVGASLTGATQLVPHAGLGARYMLNPKFAIGSTFRYRRDIFVTAANATNLSLTPVFRPQVDLFVEYLAWEKAAHQIFVALDGLFLLSRSTEAILLETSTGFSVKAKYRLKLNETNNFEIATFYENRKQNTSASEDTFTTLGLGLEYAWN